MRLSAKVVGCNLQGDQIGLFYAYWVIVSSGQYFENCESSQIFGLLSFHINSYVLSLTKNGLG
jgi:hypothetical protein